MKDGKNLPCCLSEDNVFPWVLPCCSNRDEPDTENWIKKNSKHIAKLNWGILVQTFFYEFKKVLNRDLSMQ